MPRQYTPFDPLDDQGLSANRPGPQSKWTTLDGIRFFRGRLRKRPALVDTGVATATTTGYGQLLVEYDHADAPATEIIRPDADGYHSDANNGSDWQGYIDDPLTINDVLYDKIDEAAHDPDDTIFAIAAVDGKASVTFANPGTSFTTIDQLTFHIWAFKNANSAEIRLHSRRASTDSALDTFRVSTATPTEYTVVATVDPATSAAWTVANVNSLELVIEKLADASAGSLQVSQAYVTVEGVVGAVRTSSKLYISNNGMQRAKEDLSSFEDIDNSITTPTCDDTRRWDHTEFSGYVYITDGVDDVYFYPDGSNIMDDLSAKPVGRTLATFTSRLFQGDVIESGTRLKNKARWCKTDDATDWADASAGGILLNETPGRIVKLKPIVERGSSSFVGVLAAYKDYGIYHIYATGVAADPFDKRVMNGTVGCYAMSTVQGYVNGQGEEVHAFLGHEGGKLNVYEWNGSIATPIGNQVRDAIDDEINYSQIENAFALVDPVGGNYVLAYADGGKTWPVKARVYNIERRQWTTWPLPQITTLGQWKISNKWTAVAGKADTLAYKLDPTATSDEGSVAITQTIETGDIPLNGPTGRATLYRVWIYYLDQGSSSSTISVDVSVDGGVSYSTAVTPALTGGGDGKLLVTFADVIVEGRKHRVRIQESTAGEELDLVGLVFEWEPQAEAP